MIVSIHQPNYLPWLGYFEKMDRSDIFVLLDNVKHSKSSVTHRNKILINGQSKYLSVPLKNKESIINELIINNNTHVMNKHWATIEYNYKKSPYWSYLCDELKEIYSREWIKLSDLNIELIRLLKSKLRIETKLVVASELDLPKSVGSRRNLDICLALSASTYLSGNGAKKYNNEKEFNENGIELIYQDFNHPVYNQGTLEFVEKLSILDLLFNYGEESIEILRG